MFYAQIKEIQIENTSICNAKCPMCLREATPEDKTWIDDSYVSTEFYEKNIPESVLSSVQTILFNGVIGDPCSAPNFIEVCEVFRRLAPQATIRISTNGGMKSAKFWTELAHVLGDKGEVVFGIDGLADTNHIYRVGVSFQNLYNNVNAFIAAGGIAIWQFITFKHNEHQVEEARDIAKLLGFKEFFVKPSHRFMLDELINKKHYGADNILIEPPEDRGLVHPLIRMDRHVHNLTDWMNETNHSNIDCFAKHRGTIYIDYTKKLYPCCPLSARTILNRTTKIEDDWDNLWAEHGDSKLDLELNKWDDIVNGSFFAEIVRRWTVDYSNGRIASCVGACSDSPYKFNIKK
jgi:MoaA/NifB/PqqE/SkfB family radical SAM enzyme